MTTITVTIESDDTPAKMPKIIVHLCFFSVKKRKIIEKGIDMKSDSHKCISLICLNNFLQEKLS